MIKKFKLLSVVVISVISMMVISMDIALAQSAEEDVFAVIRVSNPGDVITKVGQFAEQIQPGTSAMINSMMVGQLVFQNPSWAGMDLVGEYTAVILNPMKYMQSPFALIFPVTNKDAYLAALSQSGMTGGEEVEGIHTFMQPSQKAMFVTFTGNQGVFSEDQTVVELIKGLVTENSPLLQEVPVVKGQLVAYVALNKIIEANRPMIDGLKQQMLMELDQEMQGTEGAQPPQVAPLTNMLQTEVDMFLSLLDQTKKLQLGVSVQPDGIRLAKGVFVTSGSNLEKFIAAQTPKKSKLLGIIPADSGIIMSGSVEFTSEFRNWYAAFLKSVASVAVTDAAMVDKMIQWAKDAFEAFSGDFVFGGLSASEETLFTTIYTLKDAPKAKQLVEQYPELFQSMMGMYQEMGLELDLKLAGKTPHKGGEILNFDLGFNADAIPDPEGQEVFRKIFGEGLTMPIGFVKNYSVIGLGKNAVGKVQQSMELLDSGAVSAAKYTPAMFGLPEENNLFMYLSVPKIIKWVANYAPEAPPIEIQESPGIAMSARFVESHFEGELFVPIGEVLAITNVVQQMRPSPPPPPQP